MANHMPKGPGETWKTGQRVPRTGFWADQHGQLNHFDKGTTFPPSVRPNGGEVAYRFFVGTAATVFDD